MTNMRFLLLSIVCLGFLLPYPPAMGQNRVTIIHADQLEGTATEADGRIRKLTGNVHLESKDFTLFGDSAWQYLDKDLLHAYGNIEIISGNQTIWSDFARYDLGSEVAWFDGRVILQSDKSLLFSDEVYYSFTTEIALFPGSLRLEDRQGTLVADSGYYYNALDSAVFRGHVQIADSLQYAEADSVFMKRGEDFYELHGQVYLEDGKDHSRLTGGFVLSDSTGYRRVEGGSFMQRINPEDSDTLFLWSDWLEINESDPYSDFVAYDHVRIWNQSYQSLSDTVHYKEETERFMLTGDARLWYEETQLSGPLITIQLENDSIRHIYADSRPFAVQKDKKSGRMNQITGDSLLLDFDDQELSYLNSYSHAKILYFIEDEHGEPDGAIDIEAGLITIYFTDGELEDVFAKQNVDGSFLPEHSGIDQHRLPGYVWEPDLRPIKPDTLVEPRHPPISDERPFPLPARFTK